MFSSRTAGADAARNRLAGALDRARATGRPLLDLTASNPTRAAFDYPLDLLQPLGHAAGLLYTPEPFGLRAARNAVAADYARRGVPIDPTRIVLTASTSEAYSLIFKVLCDPGDEVLMPRPSYPLFEHLTGLDAVVPRFYDLEYHGAWAIDLDSVGAALTERTRAVLMVSPNNPTGSMTSRAELDALAALTASRGIALIADEVFADYVLSSDRDLRIETPLTRDDVLSFTLGGLSKSVGLPQVKLAWMGVAGPPMLVDRAFARLELACDTYLSVSTPVQIAAAELLDSGAPIRRQILARIRHNDAFLRASAARVPSCTVLHAAAGWYAVLQVPSLLSEEDLVIDLLDRDDVLVHPGYFFDFVRESYLVVSLLPAAPLFAEGVTRILRRFAGDAATP